MPWPRTPGGGAAGCPRWGHLHLPPPRGSPRSVRKGLILDGGLQCRRPLTDESRL